MDMNVLLGTDPLDPSPQHPGQVSFIQREQLKTKPPSLSIGSIRGGGVPAMGEHYKSRTHSLAMLKRTLDSTDLPLSKPMAMAPGTDPREERHAQQVHLQKRKSQAGKKIDLDNHRNNNNLPSPVGSIRTVGGALLAAKP